MNVLSQLLDIYSAFQLLLGARASACYQRVDVLSQLLASSLHVGLSCCYSAFELLLSTWPSACYQRVDVLSQDIYGFELLLIINDYSRSSVNTREVSEGSMGVNDTLGLALLVLTAR